MMQNRKLCRPINESEQANRRMYHDIDTEPPVQYRNDNQQKQISPTPNRPTTIQPAPRIFSRYELSPTPSSDLSTLTSSFHSVGYQPADGYYQSQEQPANQNHTNTRINTNQPVLPFQYRHSSSSIDHKSLNLSNFEQLHRVQNQDSDIKVQPFESKTILDNHQPAYIVSDELVTAYQRQLNSIDPNRSERYANYVINTARRSNSFQQAIGRTGEQQSRAQFFLSKRSSVNFSLGLHGQNYHHITSSHLRLANPLQRHLLTPVPQPPRPPEGQPLSLTEELLTSESSKLFKEDDKMTTSGFQQHQQDRLLIQQQGADSLDNIQMIVDEENSSYNNGIQDQEAMAAGGQYGGFTGNQNSDQNKATKQNYDAGTIRLAPRTSKSPEKNNNKTGSILKCYPHGQQQQKCHTGAMSHSNVSFGSDTNQQHPGEQQPSRSSSSVNGNLLKDVENAVQFDDLTLSQQQSNTSIAINYEPHQNRAHDMPLGSGSHPVGDRTSQRNQTPFVFSEVRKYIYQTLILNFEENSSWNLK